MCAINSIDSPSAKRSGVSRRTVVKGAAWAVPAIAIAAPVRAFAASDTQPCGSIDFNNLSDWDYKRTSNSLATVDSTNPAGQNVTFTSTIDGGYAYATSGTSTFPALNFGQLTGALGGGVLLQQDPPSPLSSPSATYGQHVKISFNPAVTDVTLTILGFTYYGKNSYRDAVTITSPSFQVVNCGSYVDPNSLGTADAPFQCKAANPPSNGENPDSGNAGAIPANGITPKFPGTVSEIDLTYWSNLKTTTSSIQGVYISNLKFTAQNCLPE